MKIIGLAGTHASGKDTIADYLVKNYGYFHVSTGDIVREVAMQRYGSIERPVLYKTANEIREADGHGATGHMALEKFEQVKDQYKGLVVSGFRAIAEAQAVKDKGGVIVFIDAPEQLRFERLRDRARVEEGVLSFEEFKKREEAENGGVDPAFDISAIKSISDYVIINKYNNKSEFINEVEKILGLA